MRGPARKFLTTLVALLGAWVWGQGMGRAQGLLEGMRAPEFAVESVEGKSVALRDYRGGLVYLSFFAEWCEPCKEEAPILNELAKKYPDTLHVFGIGYQQTEAETVKKVAADFHLEVPLLLDAKGTLARGYNVTNLPRGILVGPFGYVRKINKGMSAALAEELEVLILKDSLAITDLRQKGMVLLVEDFENVDDRAKEKNTGAEVAKLLRKTAAANGAALAKTLEDATFILGGTVSDLGTIVGVELVLKEAVQGRELARERASLVNGKSEDLEKKLGLLLAEWKP